MTNEVTVLIEGYVRTLPNNHLAASPSTVLLRNSQWNLLVDPGANPHFLVKSLSRQGLTPEDIDMIFLTHYHPDHILNIRLFPHQDIYDGTTLYRGDEEIAYPQNIQELGVEILLTPGHTCEHASLIIDTEKGKYAVAGDVFWWNDGNEPQIDRDSLIELPDPLSQDFSALKESRLKLLQRADFIIPGHGKTFKNPC